MNIQFLRKLLRQGGFTVMESVIGVGVLGVLGLGVMKIMEGSSETKRAMDRDTNVMIIARLLEGRLLSRTGCQSLIGRKVGDEIQIASSVVPAANSSSTPDNNISNSGPGNHNQDRPQENPTPAPTADSPVAARVAVEKVGAKLVFSEFIPSEESQTAGLARITVSLPKDPRSPKIDIYMPVSMVAATGGSPSEGGQTSTAPKTVESCNMSYIRMYEEIKNQVCSGTFGAMSRNSQGCADTMVNIWRAVAEDICDDLYSRTEGDSLMTGSTGHYCNLAMLHAGKRCPPNQKVTGFDAEGRLVCAN